MTQDTTTGIAIPEDVMEAAMEAANTILRNPDQDDFSFEVDTIARAIMAERERCARYHDDLAEHHAAAHEHVVSDHHELMEKQHRKHAAAIRTPTKGADHE